LRSSRELRFYDYYNAPTKVLLAIVAALDLAGLAALGWAVLR
jgi:hypothetical protein